MSNPFKVGNVVEVLIDACSLKIGSKHIITMIDRDFIGFVYLEYTYNDRNEIDTRITDDIRMGKTSNWHYSLFQLVESKIKLKRKHV